MADHIANVNPIRYRSYYYDRETNLYYLETRYYDPETGRFLNADRIDYLDPETIQGANLYAYCGNNPVTYGDKTGHFPWHIVGGAIIGGLLGFVGELINQVTDKNEGIDMGKVLISTAIGAGEGALIALCPKAGKAISAGAGILEEALHSIGNDDSPLENVVNCTVAGLIGAYSGGGEFISKEAATNIVHYAKTYFNKTVRPLLRKQAKNTLKKMFKNVSKTFVQDVAENKAYDIISDPTGEFVNRLIKCYQGE